MDRFEWRGFEFTRQGIVFKHSEDFPYVVRGYGRSQGSERLWSASLGEHLGPLYESDLFGWGITPIEALDVLHEADTVRLQCRLNKLAYHKTLIEGYLGRF